MNDWFHRFARKISDFTGHPLAFAGALLTVLIWGATGPLLHFSEFWQLTINTGTTICTFLMLFLVQHTQNADTRALHTKIDELIRALPAADDDVRGIEAKE